MVTNNSKQDTPTLNLADFDFLHAIHIGDAVSIVPHIATVFECPQAFYLSDYAVLYLKRGCVEGKRNGKATKFTAPDLIFLQPNTIYGFCNISKDVDACLISYKNEFTDNLNILNNFLVFESAQTRTTLLTKQAQQDMETYYEQLMRIASYKNNPFQYEAALYTTKAIFYGIGCQYYQYQNQSRNTRANELSRLFMSLLHEHGAKQRDANFYADKMHLSAKYISSAVLKATGKSLFYWTEQATLSEAKQLLTETNMTIQQISVALNFHDQSYFGAYFKRLTGMSPKQYRNAESK